MSGIKKIFEEMKNDRSLNYLNEEQLNEESINKEHSGKDMWPEDVFVEGSDEIDKDKAEKYCKQVCSKFAEAVKSSLGRKVKYISDDNFDFESLSPINNKPDKMFEVSYNDFEAYIDEGSEEVYVRLKLPKDFPTEDDVNFKAIDSIGFGYDEVDGSIYKDCGIVEGIGSILTKVWKQNPTLTRIKIDGGVNEEQVNEAYSERTIRKAKEMRDKDYVDYVEGKDLREVKKYWKSPRSKYLDKVIRDAQDENRGWDSKGSRIRDKLREKSGNRQATSDVDRGDMDNLKKALDRRIAKDDPEYRKERRGSSFKKGFMGNDIPVSEANKRVKERNARLRRVGVKGQNADSLAKSYRKYKSSNEELESYIQYLEDQNEELQSYLDSLDIDEEQMNEAYSERVKEKARRLRDKYGYEVGKWLTDPEVANTRDYKSMLKLTTEVLNGNRNSRIFNDVYDSHQSSVNGSNRSSNRYDKNIEADQINKSIDRHNSKKDIEYSKKRREKPDDSEFKKRPKWQSPRFRNMNALKSRDTDKRLDLIARRVSSNEELSLEDYISYLESQNEDLREAVEYIESLNGIEEE